MNRWSRGRLRARAREVDRTQPTAPTVNVQDFGLGTLRGQLERHRDHADRIRVAIICELSTLGTDAERIMM